MTLDLQRSSALAVSREWVNLLPEERRRRVLEAAAGHDLDILWSLTSAYLLRSTGETSAQTQRKYRLGVRRWLAYCAVQAVNVLRPEGEQADLWVRDMESSGLKPASVGVYLAGARQLYAALRWARATTASPFADSRPVRDKVRPQDKRRPYSERELKALLQAASLEMRILLRLGALSGLRASEITSLTWQQVNLDQAQISVLGKGRRVRKVLLSASLVAELRALHPSTGDAPVIGRTPEAARLRLRTLCRKADVPYLGLHALRHTAGTSLVRAGFDLQDVAEHLGHSDLQTARTYAKWADQRLRDHFANR